MVWRKTLRTPLLLFAGVATSGCATELSPRGARVAVSDENLVRNCKYLDDIGSDFVIGQDSARNDARNRAAELGATNIVFVSATSKRVMGHIYRCSSQPSDDSR